MQPIYQLPLSVRDYEVDLQGIVNNAVYQNYLEHARHEFLKTKGIDFAKYFEEGIALVVYRIEMDFKNSLKSGDEFVVQITGELVSKLRVCFHQQIIRPSDEKLIVDAKVYATGIGPRGRPFLPTDVQQLFE